MPSSDGPSKKSVLCQRKDKTVLSMGLIQRDLEVDTVKAVVVREVGAGHGFGGSGVAAAEVEVEVVVSTAAVLFCDSGGGGLRLIIGLKK